MAGARALRRPVLLPLGVQVKPGALRARRFLVILLVLFATISLTRHPGAAAAHARQEAAQKPVEITVIANRYAFSPSRIEVTQDDIVKITLKAEDIAHSFTLDEPYRIAKRAAPGRPVTFEFRAEKAGTFPFYCNLTIDERCKDMKGQLVVRAAK